MQNDKPEKRFINPDRTINSEVERVMWWVNVRLDFAEAAIFMAKDLPSLAERNAALAKLYMCQARALLAYAQRLNELSTHATLMSEVGTALTVYYANLYSEET